MATETDFKTALRFVLSWEGGYTNDPDDPGGATNLGIIQTEYDEYRKRKQLAKQSVRQITSAEAEDIYRNKYWFPSLANEKPWPVCLVFFDTAVNQGLGAMAEIRVKTANEMDALKRCRAICAERKRRYIGLTVRRPRMLKFLKGWLNRLRDLAAVGKF